MTFFPLAEVFGYAPGDSSPAAQKARKEHLCPFRSTPCTKTAPTGRGTGELLGVCSLLVKDPADETAPPTTEVICPHRFREGGVVFKELASYLFPTTPVSEVGFVSETRFTTDTGRRLGNVDWTLTTTEDGLVKEFATAEFQGLYTSGGGVQTLYNEYMALPEPRDPSRVLATNTPHPDYASSGRKRLTPQLRLKGSSFVEAGVKQAVVLTSGLYEREYAPFLSPVEEADSNLLWLVMDVDPSQKTGLFVEKRVYTDYAAAMLALDATPEADLDLFRAALQDRVARGAVTHLT